MRSIYIRTFCLLVCVLAVLGQPTHRELSSYERPPIDQVTTTTKLNSMKMREFIDRVRQQVIHLERAIGQAITLVIGQTGSGKTTLVTILGGIPVKQDQDGNLIVADDDHHQCHDEQLKKTGQQKKKKGQCDSRLIIGSGSHSVTTYPQSLLSPELGLMYDLPGFDDTNGAIPDLINAAMLQMLIQKAASVKVILVVSEAEIQASRGKVFKKFLKTLDMFPPEFKQQSVMLLVNKMKPRSMVHLSSDLNKMAKDYPFLTDLLSMKKVLAWPDVSLVDGSHEKIQRILQDAKYQLEKKVKENLVSSQPKQVNVALTLGSETSQIVSEYFQTILETSLEEMVKQEWEKKAEGVETIEEINHLEETKEEMKEVFLHRVNQQPGIDLMKSVAKDQYDQVVYELIHRRRGIYEMKFQGYINELKKRLAEKQERKAREEKVKAEEVARLAREKGREEERKRREVEAEIPRLHQQMKQIERNKEKEITQAVKEAVDAFKGKLPKKRGGFFGFIEDVVDVAIPLVPFII